MKDWVKLLIISVFIILFLWKGCDKITTSINNKNQKDTIIIETVKWDTLVIYKPEPFKTDSIKTEYVPVPYPVPYPETEYIVQIDTMYLPLPIEQKIYQDSLYKACISGFKPNLDWIEIYTPTKQIESIITPKKPSRWGLGLSAGIEYNRDGFMPYIGVGVTYDLIQF